MGRVGRRCSLALVAALGSVVLTGLAPGLPGPDAAAAPAPSAAGYWLVASDGGIFSYGDAGFHGSAGGRPPQPAHRGHGADPRRRGLLAGRLRRRHLQLRRRRLLRLDRRYAAQPAHRGHGADPRRRRLLAGRLRRRHLLLRRRRLPRVGRGHRPQPAHRGHGADPRRRRLLAGRLRRRHLLLRRRRLPRVGRGHRPQPAHRGHGADPRRRGLLAGRLRRRHLLLRRRRLRRVGRGHRPQPAHRGHGADLRRRGLLAGRLRRRHLQLRRRRLLRFDGRHAAQPAHRGHGGGGARSPDRSHLGGRNGAAPRVRRSAIAVRRPVLRQRARLEQVGHLSRVVGSGLGRQRVPAALRTRARRSPERETTRPCSARRR